MGVRSKTMWSDNDFQVHGKNPEDDLVVGKIFGTLLHHKIKLTCRFVKSVCMREFNKSY